MLVKGLDGELSLIQRHSRSVWTGRHNNSIAEVIEFKCLGADAETGSVEAPMGHVMRFGKRLMFTDSAGFVSVRRFPSVAWASAVYDALDGWYGAWEEESDEQWVHTEISRREAYLTYVMFCLDSELPSPDLVPEYDTFIRDSFRATGFGVS